jgi:hypothetical protein
MKFRRWVMDRKEGEWKSEFLEFAFELGLGLLFLAVFGALSVLAVKGYF